MNTKPSKFASANPKLLDPPRPPEQTQRDVLFVAIGSESIRIMQDARRLLSEHYSLEDQHGFLHYFFVDTDTIAAQDTYTNYERAQHVELADTEGNQNALEYLDKIAKPHLEALQESGVLPAYVTHELLDTAFLRRTETGEANKNPLKGYVYLLANLRRVVKALEVIRKEMEAPSRSIYILCSPLSGTAAGAWYMLTSFLFQFFENTSPVLVQLLPSGLRGDEEHRKRNYAIFGWSARLLEDLVRNGLDVHLSIPQLQGEDIELDVAGRQPLYTLLLSSYRNQGKDLSSSTQFFNAVAEMLPLFAVGKQGGRGMPTVDSQITNTETDQLMDEDQKPDAPTQRYCSRGVFSVRYNAKQAHEVVKLALKYAILHRLQVAEEVEQETYEQVQAHITYFFRSRIQSFYGEYHNDAYMRALGTSVPQKRLADEIEERKKAFRAELEGVVLNMRGAKNDESQIREQLWKYIQDLLARYGYGLFGHLKEILVSSTIDINFFAKHLPQLSSSGQSIEEKIIHESRKLEMIRTKLSRSEGNSGMDKTDVKNNFIGALQSAYEAVLIDMLITDYAKVLDEARQYYVEQMEFFSRRLDAIYRSSEQEYERYARTMKSPLRSYMYEMTYAEAAKKINQLIPHIDLYVQQLFKYIDYNIDEKYLEKQVLEEKIDNVIEGIESLKDMPANIAEVTHRLADNPDLLRMFVARARALVQLSGYGHETNWGIWHSGKKDQGLRVALDALEETLKQVISDEDFKVIVNNGSLPLRSNSNPDSNEDTDLGENVELIIGETILDFPLESVVTDRPMPVYWEADEEAFANGMRVSIHRVHTSQLKGQLSRLASKKDSFTTAVRRAEVLTSLTENADSTETLTEDDLRRIAQKTRTSLEQVREEFGGRHFN